MHAPLEKKAKGLRIGYLIPQFPGQTHIFFWRELKELEERGVFVRLFSTRPPPAGLISHDWSDQAMGQTTYLGKIEPLRALSGLIMSPWRDVLAERSKAGPGFLKDVLICLPAARKLIADCKADQISHVHVHSCGRAALIAALAHRMGGPRYSVTLHGPMSDYGSGQGYKWRHAEFGTIITEKLLGEARTELGADLPSRTPIQPMGVDPDVFARDTPYTPAKDGEQLRLFACGRLNVVKGHQDLLSAVRLLLDQGHDVRVDIAGEDDAGGSGYRAELQAHLETLNLSANAKLLGAIDADAVRKHIHTAHVFVLASWHEPLGVAYMEAMASGVPTIGTDAGGVPELIRDGVDGVLVPPKSPPDLAAAILRVARDSALAARLSTQGQARITQGFSSARGAETLIREIQAAGCD